jgi:hypothetical protein
MLVLGDGEEGGPAGEVLVVEVKVVVLGEGIEVGEVHMEEILRAEGAEGRHCRGRVPNFVLLIEFKALESGYRKYLKP